MSGVAPIYSFTEDTARVESAAWARFSAAKDSNEFCTSWLAILCMQIERVGGGLLLLGPDKEGAYVPAAVWPHAGRDVQYLSPAAEQTLQERRGNRGRSRSWIARRSARRACSSAIRSRSPVRCMARSCSTWRPARI